jgi:hypothetical protein
MSDEMEMMKKSDDTNRFDDNLKASLQQSTDMRRGTDM